MWLDVVEIPGVGRVDHHVVTMPKPSVTSVVTNEDGEFLLLYRHRFITGRWGWEVPAGWAEPGEDPALAISREIEEETGWRPSSVVPLIEYDALSGISTMRFQCFHATGCKLIGAPTDRSEATRVEWLPQAEVVCLLTSGEIPDGPSLTALSYYLGPHRLRDTSPEDASRRP
ncbi:MULTISPECIES: NUDIX hydrolase [unclassified Kitasatospora]|uniref:NUDIX hydrolase n=1 Tax=unclassified Kitasatospora TaxID=2633591 RepID=UPI0024740C6A|nr:NUDIX hydrolase [Kitasatospora sp. MAP12-44]